MTAACSPALVLAAILAIVSADAAAQLYKWTDENGVVNYSNTPPAKKPGAKPPVVVEEKISTYTPEKAVTDSIESARARAAAPPPPPPPAPARAAGYAPPPPPDPGGNRVGVIGPPPASQQQPQYNDPCMYPNNDPRCQQVIYSAPVGVARRPIATGNPVTSTVGPGTAIVPGQPGLNNPQFPNTPRSPVMHRPDERESFRR